MFPMFDLKEFDTYIIMVPDKILRFFLINLTKSKRDTDVYVSYVHNEVFDSIFQFVLKSARIDIHEN